MGTHVVSTETSSPREGARQGTMGHWQGEGRTWREGEAGGLRKIPTKATRTRANNLMTCSADVLCPSHEQMGWHSQGAGTSLLGSMSQPLAINLHLLLLLFLLLLSLENANKASQADLATQ